MANNRRRSRYDTDPEPVPADADVVETTIVHDVEADPTAEAHALLEAVRAEVAVRLQRESERLEQQLVRRLASVQAQAASARAEAERVRAEASALRADPIFGTIEQLRRRLESA